jgi:hypothetical protein
MNSQKTDQNAGKIAQIASLCWRFDQSMGRQWTKSTAT